MTAGHYFDDDPGATSRPSTVTLTLPDLTVTLGTDTGVFSGSGIDPGTKLLLLDGPPPHGDDGPLLDLGCGYGPIAVSLALRCPEAQVWAVDVNGRARALCAANAERNGVTERVNVVAPDAVPEGIAFGQIWSNPPIRVGKAALHDLLEAWLSRLAPTGSAHLVVQKHLGSDSLARWLTDNGFAAERRTSRGGYRLLDVRPRPADGDGGRT
ncbi:MAG: class I SAM-dependent methyltransferase [Acidimicrobiales bacterium]